MRLARSRRHGPLQPDPLYDKAHPKKVAGHYRPADFRYDAQTGTCVCPAGKSLYQNGANCRHNGLLAVKFQGARGDCVPCTQRDRCLRKPQTTKTRQVCFFRGPVPGGKTSYTDLMKRDRFGTRTSAGWRPLCHGGTGVRHRQYFGETPWKGAMTISFKIGEYSPTRRTCRSSQHRKRHAKKTRWRPVRTCHRVSGLVQRAGDRRCAALSRSVQ